MSLYKEDATVWNFTGLLCEICRKEKKDIRKIIPVLLGVKRLSAEFFLEFLINSFGNLVAAAF